MKLRLAIALPRRLIIILPVCAVITVDSVYLRRMLSTVIIRLPYGCHTVVIRLSYGCTLCAVLLAILESLRLNYVLLLIR